MGQLIYGGTRVIELEDDLLAHVRSVTLTKLRRSESFALTVRGHDEVAETIWLHASIPLRFMVDEQASLSKQRLLAMMAGANSSAGLDLTREQHAGADAVRGLHAMSA
ncbi:DUF7882 family protein [Microbacterium sp. XT11]|uniref:DUF7882 family protein n=1 Tax=Microbacterium sp. XT11 TaxID=367477 RepID=UPI000742F793|nr:hypothetical protein [Microbacterium sp. XT11]ALX66159.1 hypothetical protein AB663_001091 [Microbacterium sp. XT11]